jgi:hypothetical protein
MSASACGALSPAVFPASLSPGAAPGLCIVLCCIYMYTLERPLEGVPLEKRSSSFGYNIYLLALDMVLGGAGARGIARPLNQNQPPRDDIDECITLNCSDMCSRCYNRLISTRRPQAERHFRLLRWTCLGCGRNPGAEMSSRGLRLYLLWRLFH